jgi:hypothetical protein
MAQDEGRALGTFDDVRNGEGLSRPGHPKQYLIPLAAVQPFYQIVDGRGLISHRLEWSYELKLHAGLFQ